MSHLCEEITSDRLDVPSETSPLLLFAGNRRSRRLSSLGSRDDYAECNDIADVELPLEENTVSTAAVWLKRVKVVLLSLVVIFAVVRFSFSSFPRSGTAGAVAKLGGCVCLRRW